MNCPSCGAPLRLTESEDFCRCEYCAGVYTPQTNEDGVRLLGESSPFACPVCRLPLEKGAIGGRRVLYCAHCQGMLVPMDDFMAVVEELRSRRPGHGVVQPPVNRRDLERRLDCPQCRQSMDTHFYEGPGNFVIDDCSRCLVDWLDKGELMRAVRAPGADYSEEPAGPPAA